MIEREFSKTSLWRQARTGIPAQAALDSDKILGGHGLADAFRLLLDDRAFVEIGRDVVSGRADQL
jgi:hypothetical protein